jgi:anthranilate synthase component II
MRLSPKVLIIDHFDSFTYNLFRLVESVTTGGVTVAPCDRIKEYDIYDYDAIILSPGPGVPSDYPETLDLIRTYGPTLPVLGICLGCQAIAVAHGGKLVNLPEVVHGIQTVVMPADPEERLFHDSGNAWMAGLYHSWAVDGRSLPPVLKVTAVNENGVIMGIRHLSQDVRGVQFHPESYMTPEGRRILTNWLNV